MRGGDGQDLPTVVIVDDAPEVRALVRTRLRLSRRLAVVAEAADGAQAVELAAEHRPALMLLDVSMPVMDGLDALPRVLEVSPSTKVAMYSGFGEEGLAQRARALGAAVFLEKSTPLETLAERLLTLIDEDQPTGPVAGTPSAVPVGAATEQADRDVLEEHLERFREVFDDAAIGMATVTLAGQVVRANAALAALLERDLTALVGRPYADFAADQAAAVAEAFASLLDGSRQVAQVEHDVVGPGEPRRALATAAPVLDSAGRPLYLFLQVQDVTAQRGAEEKLRVSEAKFRLLVENVEDYAIFMLSPDGIIQSWNAGAQRIKGYREEEIVGRHFRTFYPAEVQEARHPEWELGEALREGHYEEEGWRVRKDGSLFWANVLITAVHDDDGRHVGFAKVTRDISERRTQEEALRQSEERFRLLVEAVGDYAIFMLDPDGSIASWNTGAERTQGYLAQEVIGQHFRMFYPPEQQAARHPEHELELALSEGRYEEEGWRVRKDGSRFWCHVVISAVHDEDGRHVGFAKITRDISERRALLEEREQSAAALSEANARLRQVADDQAHFLAVTAHELRTPVGVLSGSADMLADHWGVLEEHERAELLEGMGSSAQRLRRLLDDLLTAHRLQSSALELELEPVDVGELVGRAVATARRTKAGVDLEARSEPGLLVMADPDRLAQAFDNLIANALRHGVPPVRVTAGAAGDDVVIEVSDAGPGVSEEMQPRLFDRFATARGGGGTGLGLYIVRQLARAHDGHATYRPPTDDRPGAFVVTLPRATTPRPRVD